jgi:hypothetical protein
MRMQKPGYDGALTYTHKMKDGRDIYLFANSSDREVETRVTIRGRKKLTRWDPHKGQDSEIAWRNRKREGTSVTEFELDLPSAYSLFIIGE